MARPKKLMSDIKAPPSKVDMDVTCLQCGETKSSKDFYQSYAQGQKLNVIQYCKECCINLCLDENGDFNLILMQSMLRKIDRPFLNQIYVRNATKRGDNYRSLIGTYLKDLGMMQYRGLTYANSDFGKVEDLANSLDDLESALDKKKKEKKKEDESVKVEVKVKKLSNKDRNEMVDKFGRFDDDTLGRFEARYQKMAMGYNIQTTLHQEALITYCKFSVLQDIAIENNNTAEAKMYGDLATKARTDAKLNPSQLKKDDMQVGGVDSFSQMSDLVARKEGLINIPMHYLTKPQDVLDVLMWENVNYNRALFNMAESSYEDMHKIYLERIEKFNERYNADLMNSNLGTWSD